MTQFPVVRDGAIAVIEPSGRLDARATREFEQVVAGLFTERVDRIVLDARNLELLSAPAIRVLLMMHKRLSRLGGGLALCGLSDRIREVLDVAGLLSTFQIVAERGQAIATLAALATERPPAGPAPRPASALTRLVAHSLPDEGPEPASATGAGRSTLTSRVLEALGESPDSGHGDQVREDR